jgi:hypothetical protein
MLLTSVQPTLWTQQTLDAGITADITALASAMSPGQASQHFRLRA